MLAAADIDCESIRASTPPHERVAAVNRFNDEDEPVTALITTIAIGSLGLNLHRACWDGIIAEYPWNMASLDQALGRLWRLGQRNRVHWVICNVANTWYCFKEQKILDKYLADLAGNLPLPNEWDNFPHVRNTIYYEFMRCKMGTMFNRYIWQLIYRGKFADYNSPDTYAFAELLSSIAHILLLDLLKDSSLQLCESDLQELESFIASLGYVFHYALRTGEMELRLSTGDIVDELTTPASSAALRIFLEHWKPIKDEATLLYEKERQMEQQQRKMGRIQPIYSDAGGDENEEQSTAAAPATPLKRGDSQRMTVAVLRKGGTKKEHLSDSADDAIYDSLINSADTATPAVG